MTSFDEQDTVLATDTVRDDSSHDAINLADAESQYVYLNDRGYAAFLQELARSQPALARMVSNAFRTDGDVSAYVAEMNEISWEFEQGEEGGRGVSYNVAQQDVGNRADGMARILRLFGPDGRIDGRMPGRDTVVLDALAGDGTIRRLIETWQAGTGPEMICADLSRYMIELCQKQGYPAIRQSATHSLLADDVLDGVLIAYGSHHIPMPLRPDAAKEAYRTLKPGGRFVLHDFETGGEVDAFFAQVVHPYSLTGHPHPHFSRDEMWALLREAGFDKADVFEMEDPFILEGLTEDEAHAKMLRHLHSMYGLEKLPLSKPEDYEALDQLVRRTMGETVFTEKDGKVVATLMRKALIAVGEKS